MPLPDCPATLPERIRLYQAAQASQDVRDACLERAKLDYEWFIDFFVDTFDPRGNDVHDKPFLLYPYQREILKQLHAHFLNNEDLLQEKSRDMGVSWLDLAYITWHWLFDQGFVCLLGSLRELEVDDKTIDSLFGKIDYIIERLPGWMVPVGYNPRKHRKKLRLEHPDRTRNNIIMGEPATADFSRSGRYRMIFLDEGASVPDLQLAWMATSRSSDFRVICSTPKGENYFYHIRKSGLIDVQTIKWDLHPNRDQAWYDEQKKRMTAEEIAQELDISYRRSAAGVVYPEWQHVSRGHFPYQAGWPLWISIDFGVRDPTALIVWQRDPASHRVRMIDCYANSNKPIDFYVPFLTGELSEEWRDRYNADDLAWISQRSLWGPALIYGDPAGRQRSQTDARSITDVLFNDYGVSIVTNTKAVDFATRKRMTELGIRDLDLNMPACDAVDAAMSNARYPDVRWDSRGTSERATPIHDWSSHYRSAVEYFYVNIPPSHAIDRPKVTFRRAAWRDMYAKPSRRSGF